MGSFSIWHWMVVLLVVLLLFGSGKVSSLMGDFAKGIKSFKKNMADDSTDASMEAERRTARRDDRRPGREGPGQDAGNCPPRLSAGGQAPFGATTARSPAGRRVIVRCRRSPNLGLAA